MKRDFLQNFKVGDQQLSKEIIDAIMAENGRDIEAAKAPFADYETIKSQLATAQETIKGFESQDIESIRKSAKEWEDKYNQALADHNAAMDDIAFNGDVDAAISAAKGKNAKAIKALLDMKALKESKNRESDIKAALETLQKAEDSGFLFGDDQGTPPPYAAGTGTSGMGGSDTDGVSAAFAKLNPGLKFE